MKVAAKPENQDCGLDEFVAHLLPRYNILRRLRIKKCDPQFEDVSSMCATTNTAKLEIQPQAEVARNVSVALHLASAAELIIL